MKSLFPLPAAKILEAANLLEGRERYLQLIEDVKDSEDMIGLPVLTLSNKKSLRIHLPRAEFDEMVQRRLREIEDELDEMGVDYANP